MPRLSRLRVLRGRPSRVHTAPQQYSVTSSCSGRLKSSALRIEFSTYSSPSTALRTASPLSYRVDAMMFLLVALRVRACRRVQPLPQTPSKTQDRGGGRVYRMSGSE